jgi:predicted phage terminase large subunit-like protein
LHIDLSTGVQRYIVTDCKRMRGGPEKVRELVKQTAEAEGRLAPIFLPEDPGSAGKDQSFSFVQLLAGWPVMCLRQTGDKQTRAMPFAAQVNSGRVSLLRGPWNGAYTGELASFPHGRHDDQVDASSLVFNQIAGPSGNLAEWLLL